MAADDRSVNGSAARICGKIQGVLFLVLGLALTLVPCEDDDATDFQFIDAKLADTSVAKVEAADHDCAGRECSNRQRSNPRR